MNFDSDCVNRTFTFYNFGGKFVCLRHRNFLKICKLAFFSECERIIIQNALDYSSLMYNLSRYLTMSQPTDKLPKFKVYDKVYKVPPVGRLPNVMTVLLVIPKSRTSGIFNQKVETGLFFGYIRMTKNTRISF